MKKYLFLIPVFVILGLPSSAESPAGMNLPSQNINSYNKMFSIEETRPLDSLERTHYTNQAIMSIEAKNRNTQTQDSQPTPENNVEQPTKKRGLRGFFDGFVVEW